MSLKRLTALIALIYGLAALGTALGAWYQQYSLLRRGEAAAAEALSQTLLKSGPDQLQSTLAELARKGDWNGAYITEIDGTPVAQQKIVNSSTGTNLQDHTWSDLVDQFGNRIWHGRLGPDYPGPGGKTYAVWAIMDRRQVAWPLLQQIALVTAVAAWLAIATWVAYDVPNPARDGWTLLTLCTGPVGLAVWLTRRSAYRGPDRLICPGCGADVPVEAGFCPACGFAVQPVCQACSRPIALDATYCKHCGAPVEGLEPPEGRVPS